MANPYPDFPLRILPPRRTELVETDRRQLDVNPMIALAGSHSSSGWRWFTSQKSRPATNPDHPQSLSAVGATSNRPEGSRDPAERRLSGSPLWCRHGTDWMTVKVSWGPRVDQAEMNGLKDARGACDVPVTIAAVPVGDAAPSTLISMVGVHAPSCRCTSAVGDPGQAMPASGNLKNHVHCCDAPTRHKPLAMLGADTDRPDGHSEGVSCSR